MLDIFIIIIYFNKIFKYCFLYVHIIYFSNIKKILGLPDLLMYVSMCVEYIIMIKF